MAAEHNRQRLGIAAFAELHAAFTHHVIGFQLRASLGCIVAMLTAMVLRLGGPESGSGSNL